jgi:hypothetical protein
MEKINQFSVQRFLLLIKRYLLFNAKTWLIGLGATSGVMIVIGVIQAYVSQFNYQVEPLVTTGQVIIYIGGFILTSMAYNEIHTPARSQFYLTLPATTIEKLFSQWVVTSLIFVVVANILLSIVLIIGNLIGNLVWSVPFDFFNPFALANIELMLIYIITQSIFFLGAIYFRKNNFLKTILSLFVIGTALNIITVLFALLIFGTEGMQIESGMMDIKFTTWLEETFPVAMKILFYGVLTPFCLAVSYFKLKEREV